MNVGCLANLSGRNVIIFGMGGGGDIVGAAAIAQVLEDLGANVVLGSIVWERFTVDRVPGPVPFHEIRGGDRISGNLILVNGDEYAVRDGYKVVFQAVRVARLLGGKVALLDSSSGALGIEKGLNDAMKLLGVEAVVAVDVGGDVLAKGGEQDLWSPLADSVSLAGVYSSNVPVKLLCVIGLGVDGELKPGYLLGRIGLLARKGALVDIKGIDLHAATVLEKLIEGGVVTEASKLILEAYKGHIGRRSIRGGSRTVEVSPIAAVGWFLEVSKIFKDLPLACLVNGTKSIHEARMRLNEAGVATELDLEEEIYKMFEGCGKFDFNMILEARRRALNKVKNRSRGYFFKG